jgi:alpha-L-rhamnosidase
MMHSLLFSLFVLNVCYALQPPYSLQTEYLENPVGIDTPQPRFSWVLPSVEQRSQTQSAYEIIVYKIHFRTNDAEIVWDSGKVLSNVTWLVSYNSTVDLKSDSLYKWKVQWWNGQDEESDWSNLASFETAFIVGSE